ncbi:hypothetical protein PT276_08580 [Orbaceae bacterium ESL0721]|nr:hypothetical protein [Orbaceae bacterium ESL0721]
MNFVGITQYHFSQKFKLVPVLAFTLIGIIISIIAGAIYMVSSYYVSLMPLNIVILFAMIYGLSKICKWVRQSSNCRNYRVNITITILLCLVAYYSNLVTFETLFFYKWSEWGELFKSPTDVYSILLNDIIPNRMIKISRYTNSSIIRISGIWLVIFYIIEFFAFCLPVLSVEKEYHFCDECRTWHQHHIFIAIVDEKISTAIKQSPSGKYANILANVEFYENNAEFQTKKKELFSRFPSDIDSVDILIFHYYLCPKCQKNGVLTIVCQRCVRNEQGELHVKEYSYDNHLVDNIYLDTSTEQFFTDLKNKIK